MANIQKILSEEIRRLAKKEIKSAAEPLRKQVTALKQQIRQQKELITKLSTPPKTGASADTAVKESADEPKVKIRMTSARFKKIRLQLGITQVQMAQLLETSHSSIVNWENGKAKPRLPMCEKIIALGKIGKRELQKRLETLKPAE